MRWGACTVLLGCVTATGLAAAPVPPTFPSSCTLPPTGPLPYAMAQFDGANDECWRGFNGCLTNSSAPTCNATCTAGVSYLSHDCVVGGGIFCTMASSGSGPSAQVRRPFRLQSALCLPSECSEGDVPAIEAWFAYNLCGWFGGSSPTCSASISCDFGVSTSIVVIILSAIGGLAAFCLISCLVCHFCSGRRRRRRDSSSAEGARSRRLSVGSDRLLSDSDYDSSGDEEPRLLVRPGREIGNDFL